MLHPSMAIGRSLKAKQTQQRPKIRIHVLDTNVSVSDPAQTQTTPADVPALNPNDPH